MIHAHCGLRLTPVPPDGRRVRDVNGVWICMWKCRGCGRKFKQRVRVPKTVKPKTRRVKITATSFNRASGQRIEFTEWAKIPATLADAVALYGAEAIYRGWLQAHIINLQGYMRARADAKGLLT